MAYNFVTTKRIESKACKGVTYVVKRITEADRAALHEDNAEQSAELRTLGVKIRRLSRRAEQFAEELANGDIPDADAVHENETELASIMEQTDDIIIGKLRPMWIDRFLTSVEGLTIDGTAVTKDDIAAGPPELYAEIVDSIRGELGIREAELKNLLPPSTSKTSGPVEAEKLKQADSTASSAKSTGSTKPGTATSGSPN